MSETSPENSPGLGLPLSGFCQCFNLAVVCICQLTLFKCHGLCFLDLLCFSPSTWQYFFFSLPHFYTQTRGLEQEGIGKWGIIVKEWWAQAWHDLLFLYHMAYASWWGSFTASEMVLLKDVWQGTRKHWSSRELQINTQEFKILGCKRPQSHFTCLLLGEKM